MPAAVTPQALAAALEIVQSRAAAGGDGDGAGAVPAKGDRPAASRKSSQEEKKKPHPAKKIPEVEGRFAGHFAGQDDTQKDFAGLDDDDLDTNLDVEFEIPKIPGWRIEKRYYTKKDGWISLYYNYRSKSTYVNRYSGKRTTRYKKGGVIKRWRKKMTN